MIGFDTLGIIGRLGNQMFQYAALQGIAKNRGFEFKIPDHSMFHEYGGYNYHELQHCFKLPNLKHLGYYNGRGRALPEADVNSYCFNEVYFNTCPDNCSIIGYFETEKYFLNCVKEVKEDFEFKDNIRQACLKFHPEVFDKKPIALTVRRGDFLTQQDYRPLCTFEYYLEALYKFPLDRNIFVFSDDIEWCKYQGLFNFPNMTIIDYQNEVPKSYYDLCLMTMCSDYIIANSTFSWWGAWLSQNEKKTVIAPKEWFGKMLRHETKDLYPEGWIKL